MFRRGFERRAQFPWKVHAHDPGLALVGRLLILMLQCSFASILTALTLTSQLRVGVKRNCPPSGSR
jgi:hypothetical protein